MRDIDKAYQRIIRLTDRSPDGCLISRYSTGSHGYAQAWDGQTVVLAHRLVWEWNHGPIPKGMTIDHLCHNRKCIEITHLRQITNLDNARRNGPGDWPLDGQCKHGHGLEHWKPKGPDRRKGYCAACQNRYTRRPPQPEPCPVCGKFINKSNHARHVRTQHSF
jgi:hypothetical protein